MPRRKPKMTFHSLGVVQRLREAIRIESSFDYVGLKHRVPIRPADGGLPIIFTIEISRTDAGLFVATCHEFPGLVVTGDGEHDVLVRAELEVGHLLAGGSRDRPQT